MFLVSAFQEITFNKKPFDLRDKRILSFERDKVDSVEVTRHDGAIVQLARNGSEWVREAAVRGARRLQRDRGAADPPAERLDDEARRDRPKAPRAATASRSRQRRVTVGAGSSKRGRSRSARKRTAQCTRRTRRAGLVFTIDPTLASRSQEECRRLSRQGPVRVPAFNVGAAAHHARRRHLRVRRRSPRTGENAADKWQRDRRRRRRPTSTRHEDGRPARQARRRCERSRSSAAATAPAGSTRRSSSRRATTAASSSACGSARTGEAFAARDGEPGAAKLDASAYDDVIKALDAALAPPAPAEPAKQSAGSSAGNLQSARCAPQPSSWPSPRFSDRAVRHGRPAPPRRRPPPLDPRQRLERDLQHLFSDATFDHAHLGRLRVVGQHRRSAVPSSRRTPPAAGVEPEAVDRRRRRRAAGLGLPLHDPPLRHRADRRRHPRRRPRDRRQRRSVDQPAASRALARCSTTGPQRCGPRASASSRGHLIGDDNAFAEPGWGAGLGLGRPAATATARRSARCSTTRTRSR